MGVYIENFRGIYKNIYKFNIYNKLMEEYKLTSVRLKNEDLEYLRKYGGIRKFIEDNIYGKVDKKIDKNKAKNPEPIRRDLSIELTSLKNWIKELEEKIKVLESSLTKNNSLETILESRKKPVEDILGSSAKFICSVCNAFKSLDGRKRDNSGRWVCAGCFLKHTNDEQQL